MVGKATVHFELPRAGDVRLDVFDTVGRRVTRLASAYHEAGDHRLEWDAARQPSGIYLVRLEVGAEVATHKVFLQH
jgi:hypothetical protein